jgi:hypothetical protein
VLLANQAISTNLVGLLHLGQSSYHVLLLKIFEAFEVQVTISAVPEIGDIFTFYLKTSWFSFSNDGLSPNLTVSLNFVSSS